MSAVPQTIVCSDTAELVASAGRRFLEIVAAAQTARGSASVVLTGGSNGIALLSWLRHNSAGIDWSAVDVYFGDDRYVPSDSDERNYKQAREALLDFVKVDESRVFAMAASDGAFGVDIGAAADDYARTLAAHTEGAPTPEFDVHLLGMGGEGHINSLFPHTAALAQRVSSVVAVTDSPKPPARRITLTVPTVNRARNVLFLVSGADKAIAVAAGTTGEHNAAWPCSNVGGTESTVWFLDAGAAADL